jgi:sortase B
LGYAFCLASIEYQKKGGCMMKPIRAIAAAILIAIIVAGGLNLWAIQADYAAESKAHENAMRFKQALAHTSNSEPGGPRPPRSPTPQAIGAPESALNQGILELQREYEGAVGWLTVDGTGIDYPFAQANDNAFYLQKDLNGNHMKAGTNFPAGRNDNEFSAFNTLLSGHSMNNDSMFGTLRMFGEQAFFEANGAGSIVLADHLYMLEAFAYMVIRADDEMIYGALRPTAEDALRILAYIQRNARHYRPIEITPNDRLVTLSTCAHEFGEARMVLICRLQEF